MMKKIPSKLITRATLVFTVLFFLSIFLWMNVLKLYDLPQTRSFQLAAIALSAVIIFILVALQVVKPLGRVIDFLQRLLEQPKTENIRVEADDFSEGFFVNGEWGELGELVRQVEGKLRRRTKALLREKTELSAVMNSMYSPIVSVTTKKEVSFFNTAFAVLFDLEKVDLDENSRLENLIEFQELTALIYKSMDEETFDKKMLVMKTVGERERIFSVGLSPLRRGVDNSLYGVVATLTDETQKIALDQKRMDFVANASHELRTPLAAVFASVQLLSKLEDEKTRKEVFSTLESNTKRLVNLGQDLLDLSKLENSEEVLDAEDILLKDFTYETLKEMGVNDDQRIECAFDAPSAYFDGSKAKQVLTNLVSNALQYTPDGAKVFVSWKSDQERGGVVLEVKDQGEGISTEEQDRIFERFYRVDKSRSRKRGGTGIGLSIVKHIMSMHEGSVSLDSEVGEGATFRCFFPFQPMNQFVS